MAKVTLQVRIEDSLLHALRQEAQYRKLSLPDVVRRALSDYSLGRDGRRSNTESAGTLQCRKCGHSWVPRNATGTPPYRCPACFSKKWQDA